ncbi:MAG: hypothetical protein RTU92_09760 [Candidatus Thorarchaeota archaeon]
MAEPITMMKYEFFSWKGFVVGAIAISLAFIFQSIIGFPTIWQYRAAGYVMLIVISAMVVGTASGAVLVFLFPPDQDVIGVSGLGSDNASQHISLLLVVLALVQPILSGFVFFFDYFGPDQLIFIWVLIGFAAPSLGLTIAMFDRTNAIADDLKLYFVNHDELDLTSLEWLIAVGPRTATYRMGMLESAARKTTGLRIRGHMITREESPVAISGP